MVPPAPLAIPVIVETAPAWLPVLEAATVALLTALGLYTADKYVKGKQAEEAEAQRRRREFVENGEFAEQVAQSVAQTEATTCTGPRTYCPALPPPHGAGMPVAAATPNKLAATYQALATGFPPGLEWMFMHPKSFWDGFWPVPCTLVEAKGEYEKFFDAETGLPRWSFADPANMFETQATLKAGIVSPFHPPLNLLYRFAYPGPMMAFQTLVANIPTLSFIKVELFPWA